MQNDIGAFVPGERLRVRGTGGGSLEGYTFAAKDVFDIAGHPTGNGQPTWRKTHPIPDTHATAIEQLLNAGATLEGKTVCDEMCYSLAGDNAHYGAPINPAAPDRSVGGSSSGSAAAVAGELVDFALGTDCGGSVRCPASFSAIYGIRPTHGRVDDAGVTALASSFDVVGWFSRDASLLGTVGDALLQGERRDIAPVTAIFADDAFARLNDAELAVAEDAAGNLVQKLNLATERVVVAPDGLDRWLTAFRNLQALEIWKNHASWVTDNSPDFGPGVRERFAYASTLTETDRIEHEPIRELSLERMDKLIGDGTSVLVMPTAPVSPMRDASDEEVEDFRTRVMGLTCPAGLSGFPQISMPLASASGPLGISLLGPPGSDESLLSLIADLMA